jgi:hypothetical protein
MIRLQAAGTFNQRLDTGAYRGARGNFSLTYRF